MKSGAHAVIIYSGQFIQQFLSSFCITSHANIWQVVSLHNIFIRKCRLRIQVVAASSLIYIASRRQGSRLIINMQRLASARRLEPAQFTTDFYNTHTSRCTPSQQRSGLGA